ncbi:hypothetical protein AMS59_03130 [Lysinibacillus sp. FJAT-14745]|uniref:hypothetical protein n=1 Tax=Lysinibacillus sp. FJAT-14745 TaxID=1704289 RepID=UPI0006ABA7E8|nr:hypothetical protein [Lysinibacillus sp. FJAT-14745]KOP80398.1 hypothetical protein AMS59_03130 [Lysinibacillus sp. FJAT-14745]
MNIDHVNDATVETKNMASLGRSSVRYVIEQMNEIADNTTELSTRVKDLDENTVANRLSSQCY